jgi:hypothetical protein
MNIKYFLWAFLIVAFSCKKHNDITNGSIRIGDNSNMIINKLDTSLVLEYNFSPISIDVDNDGTNDIKILYKDAVIRFNDYFMAGAIECLNQNTYLSIVNSFDTTYYEYIADTSYSSAVFISTHANYYCERKSNNCSINRIDQNQHLKVFFKGNVVSSEDLWGSGTYVFANLRDEPSQTYWDYHNNDTIWLHFRSSYLDCYFLPLNQNVFISFKKVHDDEIRYGWIQLSIFKTSLKRTLYITESAIQK